MLVDEATARLVAGSSLRSRFARSFDHKIMKLVCQDYLRIKTIAAGQIVSSTGQAIPKAILDIASEFITLQQVRHQADYDTSAMFTQSYAQTNVMRAELAFLYWESVQTDPAAENFLAELLCRGIPKR